MPPSLRLALNALTGRRWRTILLIAAVGVAAALVVAVSTTSQSVQASLDDRLGQFLGSADVRIIHQGNGRFEEAWLERARGWEGVVAATARLSGSLVLVRADGRTDPETGRPLRATPEAWGEDFGPPDGAEAAAFRAYPIERGSLPAGPGEVLLDPMTAEALEAAVGDVLVVQRFGPPIELTVSGVYERQKLHMLQRQRVRLDRRTLAEVAGHAGMISTVLVDVADDVDVETFVDRHAGEMPEIMEIEPADMVRAGLDKQASSFDLGLLLASIMTFMSAAFIIVTGLTTSVAERERELAVMRCVGAGRRQLFAAQLMVGLGFGVIGAAVGVPLGIGLSWGLITWFRDLLPSGMSVSATGVRLAVVGSVASGLAGAVYPALIASRTPPLQAMTSQARPGGWRGLLVAVGVGALLVAGHRLIMGIDGRELRFFAHSYVGLPALFIAAFVLATPILMALTTVLGPLLARAMGLPPDLLVGAIGRMRYRNGFTAGALMVGITILVVSWSTTSAIMRDWIGDIEFADGFAYRSTGIPAEHQQAIAELPFVVETCGVGHIQLEIADDQVFGIEGLTSRTTLAMGFEPREFFSINHIDWVEGDPGTAIPRLLEGDAVIVADRYLTARGLGVGDTLTLGRGDVLHDFEIVGVVSSPGLEIAVSLLGVRDQYSDYANSCVFLDLDAVERLFDNRDVYLLQVELSDDIDDETATERIMDAAPGSLFFSGRWIIDSIRDIAVAAYTVQSTIAFAALILASIGVGNVILAGIHGRRYEFGLLRAVGGRRSHIGRLLLSESILLAAAGAVTGTALGLYLAWVDMDFYRTLVGLELELRPPILPILAGWLTLVALTMAAALPGLIGLNRRTPSGLLAGGRHGSA